METGEGVLDSQIDELHQELLELLADSHKLIEKTSKISKKKKKTTKTQLYVPVIFSEDEDEDVPTLSDAEFDQLLLDIKELPLSTIDVLKLMLQQLEENLQVFDINEIVFNIRYLKTSTLRIMKSYVDSKLRKPRLTLDLIPKRMPRMKRVQKSSKTSSH